MPKSKHRHKSGGKNIKRPGRRLVTPPSKSLEEIVWTKFYDSYVEDFVDKWRDEAPEGTDLLLDIIFDVFDADTLTLAPASKTAVFAEFAPAAAYGKSGLTPEMAEAALAFVVGKEWVSVDGDEIVIPSHFLDAVMPPPP